MSGSAIFSLMLLRLSMATTSGSILSLCMAGLLFSREMVSCSAALAMRSCNSMSWSSMEVISWMGLLDR